MEFIKMRVERRRELTPSVTEFTLKPIEDVELPGFMSGAHITVETPSGAMRRYSLVNDGSEPKEYVIAVKREFKSRGGSASIASTRAIHACLVEGLKSAGLPAEAIQVVPVTDRAAVGEMLKGLNGNIDVIVPRGGKSLVARVQSEARVPVFAHLEGLCHVYIDKSADPEMARKLIVNSKMRRTGICGAAETLLLDRALDTDTKRALVNDLIAADCEVRGDEAVQALSPDVKPAEEADWSTEYLDAIISACEVDGIDGAIAHISRYSSNHTEAVFAEDAQVVEKFFNEIDSAILLHNASTQFADGGEFGMGAEIGIATGKMHARGPVGVEQLTSFKYRVRGSGQTRP